MGRRKKDYEFVPNEEYDALADYFLRYMGEIYNDYIELFNAMFGQYASDLFHDTILKIHSSLRHNGLRKLNGKDVDEETKKRMLRDYMFISIKLNNITKKQDEAKRRGIFQSDNDGVDMVDSESSDAKVRRDLLKDYMVMRIIDIVEDNFDDISFRCYRLYSLLDGMTYAKLKQLTGITNCKQRVVDIKKWLRDNVDEEELRKDFEREYDINIII